MVFCIIERKAAEEYLKELLKSVHPYIYKYIYIFLGPDGNANTAIAWLQDAKTPWKKGELFSR